MKMAKEKIICEQCGKLRQAYNQEICNWCYRKHYWKRKLIVCKRCKREKPMHAKGYCAGCYNFVFQLENTKAHNVERWHNIDYELYKRITKSCLICGFDKVVDLHHLDENKKNNSESNLIGLCPNHHKMLHDFKWRKETIDELNNVFRSKGLPEFIDHKTYSCK